MSSLKLLALLVAFLCSAAMAAVPGDVEVFDPQRDAAQDIAHAVEQAKKSGKRVLLDVGGDWCSWCHLLDRMFVRHADLQRLREDSYVWVKVNYSPENKNAAVLARYPKFKGYPHIFVLDADGTVLHSQDTSKLEEGKDYSLEKLTAFLERWRPVKK